MSRDIGEPTTLKVGKLGEILLDVGVDVLVEIAGHRVFLVPSLREVVAEAARARGPGDLWCVSLSSAHGGDVWAGPGELRGELGSFLAVVGLARGADT